MPRFYSAIRRDFTPPFTASFFHIISLLYSLPLADQNWPFSASGTICLFVYAVINLSYAHFLWLYVISKGEISAPAATIYLIPVLSTLGLGLFFGLGINSHALCGLSLILVGIYLSRLRMAFLSPIMAASLAVLISWALSLLFMGGEMQPHSQTMLLSVLKLLTAMFAIVSSFILSQAISHHRKMDRTFIEIFMISQKLFERLRPGKKVSKAVDDLRTILVDGYAERSGKTFGYDSTLNLQQAVTVQMSVLGREALKNSTATEDSEALLSELKHRVTDWLYCRKQLVSSHEWFVLILLTFVIVFGSFSLSYESVSWQIARVAFTTALVTLNFAIRDYDRGRPHKMADFLVSLQHSYPLVTPAIPYIPAVLSKSELMPRGLIRLHERFRTRDDSGSVVTKKFSSARIWLESSHFVLLLIVLLIVCSSILKYVGAG